MLYVRNSAYSNFFLRRIKHTVQKTKKICLNALEAIKLNKVKIEEKNRNSTVYRLSGDSNDSRQKGVDCNAIHLNDSKKKNTSGHNKNIQLTYRW